LREGLLVLADGTTFEGEIIGAAADRTIATGEVVFNTVLAGYQEVITDPSYAGQIITFTYPHIGNYGVTEFDDESARPFCRGVVVRDLSRRRSSWRSTGDLDSFLRRHSVAGIAGIDTRRLTRHLRDFGAVPGAFGYVGAGGVTETELKAAAAAEPGTDGVDLVAEVTCPRPYTIGTGPRRVVAYDFGIKRSILRQLGELATVEVVPAWLPASEVIARRPDGVFLSNGPGDPAMVAHAVDNIHAILDADIPLFGICLGHQLLSRALGGTTFKLPFGHHGGNHPVRNVATGHIEITSQNHNFCVDIDSLADVSQLTHLNLNDQTVEGMRVVGAPAFSVQYHPEAGPGPHDARYLFDDFDALIERSAK
jgi:carbamoyl-phosphate synthase small subunit